MRGALLATVLAAAPLASGDAASQLAAVEKWAQGKKPQLSFQQAMAVQGCVELPAVKEAGCETPAKLCSVMEGDDGSSGTRVESLSFVLAGHEELHNHLRVWWRAAYEPRRWECDPPASMTSDETPAQRTARVEAWRSTHRKEWLACVARAEKDSADDAEELSCDLVLVNACRSEAFVRCRAKNLRAGVGTIGKLHRVVF